MKTFWPAAFTAAIVVLALAGCIKDKELTPLGNADVPISVVDKAQPFDSTGQRLVVSGTFRNGVHAVSGSVRFYERNGQQTLVFRNFKSDTGPDLRIYLAADTQARAFTEVDMLKATGNFWVAVPPALPPGQQRYVLIWCKRFAVHFGNAELN